jgi:hypothetical protein
VAFYDALATNECAMWRPCMNPCAADTDPQHIRLPPDL